MISFKGELSNESKAFVRKKHIKAAIILSAIGSVIFAIPVIMLGIFWDSLAYLFLIAVAGIPFLTFVDWVGELTYLTQIDLKTVSFMPISQRKIPHSKCMAVHGKWQTSNLL